MPARNRSFTLSLRISFPWYSICPLFILRIPVITSASSFCPLPSTPAIPRISPLRIVRLTWSRDILVLCFLWRHTSLRLKAVSPAADSLISLPALSSRPIMQADSSSGVVSSVTRLLTFRPSRSTVTRSLISMISPRRWVMIMIPYPSSRSRFKTPKKFSVSWGVSTPVGSSRINRLTSRYRAFRISTLCCSPTERVWTGASGFTKRP